MCDPSSEALVSTCSLLTSIEDKLAPVPRRGHNKLLGSVQLVREVCCSSRSLPGLSKIKDNVYTNINARNVISTESLKFPRNMQEGTPFYMLPRLKDWKGMQRDCGEMACSEELSTHRRHLSCVPASYTPR